MKNKKLTQKELGKIDRTFDNFVGQFGKDVYTKIMLEVLLEELYGKSIPVSGESEQKRSDNIDNTGRALPTYEIE